MPTKRRFIIFIIVLAVMLLIKRAVGQEAGPQDGFACPSFSLGDTVAVAGYLSLVLGVISGTYRALGRSRSDRYFTGDLIQLRLR